jgi:hypothetical protein
MGIVIYKYLSDPNWLLAVFTLILVIVAILTLRAQTKSFKLTIGADLAMKLDERFSEPAFLADRVHAAEALKSQLNLKEAENVFDFLDMVGLFVRLKALDPEIAHSLFFHFLSLDQSVLDNWKGIYGSQAADSYAQVERLQTAI